MNVLRLGLAVGVAVGIGYLVSWPLRYVFRMGQGPLMEVDGGDGTGRWEKLLRAGFKIGIFYATVVTLALVAATAAIGALDVRQITTDKAVPVPRVGAIVGAVIAVAVARILAMTYSLAAMRSLHTMSIGTVGFLGFLAVCNPGVAHDIVQAANKAEPGLMHFYFAGVLAAAAMAELCWWYGPKVLRPAGEVMYSLVREYHEGCEPHEAVAYRGRLKELFSRKVTEALNERPLEELCWKTWSGERAIARAILDAVKRKAGCATDDEAREVLKGLATGGKARILAREAALDAQNNVKEILGISPRLIRDVGALRYLVLNREVAIISLPVPAGFSDADGRRITETASNFAIATRDPSRVHECLRDFSDIWNTAAPAPAAAAVAGRP